MLVYDTVLRTQWFFEDTVCLSYNAIVMKTCLFTGAYGSIMIYGPGMCVCVATADTYQDATMVKGKQDSVRVSFPHSLTPPYMEAPFRIV